MIYKIDSNTIAKLVSIESALNNIEVKGFNNLSLLYSTLVLFNEIKQEIEKENASISEEGKE